MFKKLHKQQSGFTLVEVLVVVGILAILLAITLIALNPAKHFASTRNTQRSSDVTAILDAIYQYQAANKGSLPSVVTGLTAGVEYDLTNDTNVAITNKVDLCSLVPTYVADLPIDPDAAHGDKASATACGSGVYHTGYRIIKSASDRFTVVAPWAEDSAIISVTR